MSFQIRDGISPALARAAARIRDRRPVLEAMGAEFGSLSKRAFVDASLRLATWPNKKDGTPATLRQSGALFQSIRIAETTNASVTVGSDRPHAAAQQLGNEAGHLPPRPFFPVLQGPGDARGAKED